MNKLKALPGVVWNYVRFQEPVVVWHAGAAAVALLAAVKVGHVSYGVFADAWLAMQAFSTRHVVTPTPSIPAGLKDLVRPEG